MITKVFLRKMTTATSSLAVVALLSSSSVFAVTSGSQTEDDLMLRTPARRMSPASSAVAASPEKMSELQSARAKQKAAQDLRELSKNMGFGKNNVKSLEVKIATDVQGNAKQQGMLDLIDECRVAQGSPSKLKMKVLRNWIKDKFLPAQSVIVDRLAGELSRAVNADQAQMAALMAASHSGSATGGSAGNLVQAMDFEEDAAVASSPSAASSGSTFFSSDDESEASYSSDPHHDADVVSLHSADMDETESDDASGGYVLDVQADEVEASVAVVFPENGDALGYLANHSDLQECFSSLSGEELIAALKAHYINHGCAEGRVVPELLIEEALSPVAPVTFPEDVLPLNYLRANSDLREGMAHLVGEELTAAVKSHYVNHGHAEGRHLAPVLDETGLPVDFDAEQYAALNADLSDLNAQALENHFRDHGNAEMRFYK